MRVSTRHRLLPHEQWYAGWLLERQRTHRGPFILRMEQNYGREGIILYAAAWINVFPCQVLMMAGLVLLVISGGQGSLTEVTSWLAGIGAVLGVAGLIRAAQAARAARTFRGGRPFIRRF